MSKKGGNFEYNYPKVIKYLKDNDIEFFEYNGGHHIKILGGTSLIDLWPSKMKYHVIGSEGPSTTGYYQLSSYFEEKELDEILNQ